MTTSTGYSLITAIDDDQRFLSQSLCTAVFDRIFAAADLKKYWLTVQLSSTWEGNIRWARNRASLASNRRRIRVGIHLGYQDGRSASMFTNQLDDASLTAALRAAERVLDMHGGSQIIQDFPLAAPKLTPPEVKIWNDATYNTTNELRGALARVLAEDAEKKDLLSAGFLAMEAGQVATKFHLLDGQTRDRYDRYTNAECSMTVRHPQGIGSGWAGVSSYDWSAIDGRALATRALEKCVTSLNPVRIEPGRYTVILEPQAVYQLVKQLLLPAITLRNLVESSTGRGPYRLGYDSSLQLWRSKLGIKIVDERVTIRHNPMDPLMGVIPVAHAADPRTGDAFSPVLPITWIEHGVLTALNYRRDYAVEQLKEDLPLLTRSGFFMDGGESSIEEMIASTKRGLLVTRFSDVSVLELDSLLCTGITRDGLWLIENGAISKAVHNFRFTESPLFVLNQLESLGTPMPVYTESLGGTGPAPAFVPPIKANDFSFTALVDAI